VRENLESRQPWRLERRMRLSDHPGLPRPTDVTDDEWALIAPLIPPERRGGRPRGVDLREVLNAVLFVLSTGCAWGLLPREFGPKSTAHFYYLLWLRDGTLDRIHAALFGTEGADEDRA
jgi:transposase